MGDTMANVKDVAHWFVNNNQEISKADLNGNLKLQKLLYYSQAMHLVITDEAPLFNSRIEAWEKGPVVPEVYAQYRHHSLVTDALVDSEYLFKLSDLEQKILNIINYVFGSLSSDELVKQTHEEEPWATKKHLVDIRANPRMHNTELARYYHYLSELYEAHEDMDFESIKTFELNGTTFSYEGELELTSDERTNLSTYKDDYNSSYFIYRDEDGELVVY